MTIDFSFQTRRPGAFGQGAQRRAPHLHFQVTTRSSRLVTQMFFPGEVLNRHDRWLNAAGDDPRLIARLKSSSLQSLELEWEVVMSVVDERRGATSDAR